MPEYRYQSTAIRLAAWRKHSAETTARYLERGAPAPDEYKPGTLPPNWFGSLSSATPNREPYEPDGRTTRTPTYNYGEGLGTGRTPSRPFRFVGFADEVKEARIRHEGWYSDEHGDNLCRGVVFQIPARGGNTQYLAGCEWGESSRKGWDSGGGWIEIGRGDVHESKEDAARMADEIARIAAERERDYQETESARIREEEEEAERVAAEEEAEQTAAHLERINPVLAGTGYQIGRAGSDIFLQNEEGERL